MATITVTSRDIVSSNDLSMSGHPTRTWKNAHGRGEPKIRSEGQFAVVTDEYGAETWIPFDLILRIDVSEPRHSF